jgi:sortase (surface protein transpeptidase)
MDLGVEPAEYVTFNQNGQIVSDWIVPFDAAGHLVSSVQPGEIGNAVLSGHHNLTAEGKFGLGVFAGIWNLSVGDEIQVKTEDGKEQLWRVKETFPVKEAGEPLSVRIQHAKQIMSDTPLPTLTLVTCWNGKSNPLSGNTYRWVIHAELVNIN